MSSDPNCGVCEGAGWDWRRAADDDLQVDDPVDYYECPCVEVMRLRADVERLRAEVERTRDYACRMDALAEERLMQATRLRAAGDAMAKRLWRGGGDLADMIAAVAAWEEACRGS